MSKNTGGPAFPRPAVFTAALGLASTEQEGMTLRDYFAAKAMQGMLSDADYDPPPQELAICSYAAADAMLAEREK